MNKLKLTIDTESINMENEIHINNFSQKIKSLALHCVNFINAIEDEKACSNNKFLPEFHDDNESTHENELIPSLIKTKLDSNYIINNTEFPALRNY